MENLLMMCVCVAIGEFAHAIQHVLEVHIQYLLIDCVISKLRGKANREANFLHFPQQCDIFVEASAA